MCTTRRITLMIVYNFFNTTHLKLRLRARETALIKLFWVNGNWDNFLAIIGPDYEQLIDAGKKWKCWMESRRTLMVLHLLQFQLFISLSSSTRRSIIFVFYAHNFLIWFMMIDLVNEMNSLKLVCVAESGEKQKVNNKPHAPNWMVSLTTVIISIV